MHIVILGVAGLLVVAAAATLAPKLCIPAPLVLVIFGIVVSALPGTPVLRIDPEWVLIGILPPLLYSAAVAMPVMNFRREFSAISGLSVSLVVLSSLVLGVLFSWLVPDVGLWWGTALGAIVSPTDAVAVSIVRRAGVSSRVISVLDGESLLNDATALVLLRTAIVGTAASISVWDVIGGFAYAIVAAILLGILVGKLNLFVRSHVSDSTVNTVISFTVPFLAAIPAELLGASGLVAAVVAGLITGHGAARRLPARHRLSDSQNWHTVELVLEGAIFLIMGLELAGIVDSVRRDHDGIGIAIGIAAAALIMTVVVRAAFIVPLLAGLRRRSKRKLRGKERLAAMEHLLESSRPLKDRRGRERPAPPPQIVERVKSSARRALFDIDYLLAAPLGWRDGGILVWAGMRGAITLAAAQTLPAAAPHRSLLVLIAFVVAAGSLVIQGGTLVPLARVLTPKPTVEATSDDELQRLDDLLDGVRRRTEVDQTPHGDPSRRGALQLIEAQRKALLDARDVGEFSAQSISHALLNLDADQIRIELKGDPRAT